MYYIEKSEKTQYGEHFAWTQDGIGNNEPCATYEEADATMDALIKMWPGNDYRIIDEDGTVVGSYDGYDAEEATK